MRAFRRKLFSLWRWRTRPQLWERCLGSVGPPSAAPVSGSRRLSQTLGGNLFPLRVFCPLSDEPVVEWSEALSVCLCPWSGEGLREIHLPVRVDTPWDGCSEICRQSHHQEPRRPAAHLGHYEAWKWVRLFEGFGDGYRSYVSVVRISSVKKREEKRVPLAAESYWTVLQ